MFTNLKPLPADPILGLSTLFKADTNPQKVDLGVGVYKNDAGQTVIMEAVQKAYQHLCDTEGSKVYVSPAGWAGFTNSIAKLALGSEIAKTYSDQLGAVQTPGGCGALRLGFELISGISPEAKVWVSNPTWANHIPIITASGLGYETYDYYNKATSSIDLEAMIASLRAVKAGDIVLLHGCCHNPTGADIPAQDQSTLIAFLKEQGLVPFVDMAYQGFAEGLDTDAGLTRQIFEEIPEAFLTYSCSKNFGLYRERTGAIIVKGPRSDSAPALTTHLCKIARQSYSMPPAHGAALVTTVMESDVLCEEWRNELEAMRSRVVGLRTSFATALSENGIGDDVTRVGDQAGMFSILNLSEAQVLQLRNDYSIYMPSDGRINVAGLTFTNIPYVVNSILSII